ncbi:MAG: hypothetical protein WBF01_15290, partial [Candidatus Acidiferrum sp.]
FDGGDFFAGDVGDRQHAGARSLPIEVDGSGTALHDAATKLCAGHIQGVAQHPEKGHVGANVNGLGFSVQDESDGHGVPPKAERYRTTIGY